MAIIVLAATVGLLLFLLVAVLLVKFNGGGPAGPPTGTSIPGVPRPPGAPPGPPAPPVPPPAPPALGEPVVDESLRYPGAEEIMAIKKAQGKAVLQLQTKDSADKVSQWYTTKLKPTEHVKLPFGNAILRAGDIAVVITGNEDGTSILITRGGD
jgi:hypothetical protein